MRGLFGSQFWSLRGQRALQGLPDYIPWWWMASCGGTMCEQEKSWQARKPESREGWSFSLFFIELIEVPGELH